jgi:hypothetical protein
MNINMNWAFHHITIKDNDLSKDLDNYNDKKLPMSSEGKFDDDLYDLLNELHFVIGYQRIVEENNNQINENENKNKKIQNLIKTDKYHSDLMYLKKVFYCEVNERLENLESIFDSRDIDLDVNKFYMYGWHKYFPNNFDLDITYNFLIQILRYYSHYSKNSYAIINVLLQIGNQLNKIDSHNIDMNFLEVADTILRISFIFKDEDLDEELQLYGLVLFIYFFEILCHDIPGFKTNSSLIEFVEYFDQITSYEQNKTQNNLLMCYQTIEIKKSTFYSRINSFAEILRSNTDIQGKYIQGTKCFATMNYNGERYFSLSGSEETEGRLNKKYKTIFDSLQEARFKKIQLNYDTRYYYKAKYFILYEDYQNYIKNGGNKDDGMDRLFSCCERKLLTYLYKQPKTSSFQMYIKFKPCKMCERALNDYEDKYVSGNAIHVALNSKPAGKFTISNFDKLANKIRKKLK